MEDAAKAAVLAMNVLLDSVEFWFFMAFSTEEVLVKLLHDGTCSFFELHVNGIGEGKQPLNPANPS
ncbi:MAG TPA: hypothetical protein VMY42_05195 [Thermoguttaceae bacterium]|nr:hypothetical protein [Thermoguttaceae bacterium]